LAEGEFQRARRFQHDLAIMMLDIDQFKEVNDTYGHMVGDQVLHELAGRCMQHVRVIDLIGRYGGDEFIFVLVETDAKEAYNVAERIRKHVADGPVVTDGGPLNMSVSLGIAILDAECKELSVLVNRADNALYMAKKANRNRVVVSEKTG